MSESARTDLDARIRVDLGVQVYGEAEWWNEADKRANALRAVLDECSRVEALDLYGPETLEFIERIRSDIAGQLGVAS